MTKPSQGQLLTETLDKVKDKLHDLIFIYKADWQHYGKLDALCYVCEQHPVSKNLIPTAPQNNK